MYVSLHLDSVSRLCKYKNSKTLDKGLHTVCVHLCVCDEGKKEQERGVKELYR